MADGVAYPTQDHVSNVNEWAEPPYVDPDEAQKDRLRKELSALEEAEAKVKAGIPGA
jgi:hypothetical protein